MGLHISLCCDFCTRSQTASFDSVKETFEDLIGAYVRDGWRVSVSETARIVGARCPDCDLSPRDTRPDVDEAG